MYIRFYTNDDTTMKLGPFLEIKIYGGKLVGTGFNVKESKDIAVLEEDGIWGVDGKFYNGFVIT